MKVLLCSVTLLTLSFFTSAQASLQNNPWPEIRKQRIEQLLPNAMREAGVDAWLIICRENANDPLAKHIGCENAGKTALFLFYFADNNFHSKAFSPIGEATALKDNKVLDEVVAVARDASAVQMAGEFLQTLKLQGIAINSFSDNPQADGLSHSQYLSLTKSLGADLSAKLVSSERLVYEWLAVKLPAEVDIMREAAALTAKWQLEAYAQVVPGKTTDAELAAFLKQKMKDAGVTDAWAPDQNPNVVSGTDRGHSHATDRIIQAGDVIQTDFGIRVYDKWVTDIQRFAYVLKPGESAAPKDIAYYWESAKQGRDAAFKAMQPGATGQSVDAAQREVMQATKSRHVMWSTGHPVGYVAHDSGPALSDGISDTPRAEALLPLKPGMTFAFDGFHSWLLDNGNPKTISVEEMVVITETGAEYLIPPQLDLVLIPSN